MNKIVILEGDEIGSIDAEYDDKFLFDCFVYLPSFNALVDPTHPHSFIYGRTGSGKTAIIRKIQNEKSITQIIDLSLVSLDYITNSDVIQYLTNIGVDLDIFFQTLWKHVLCLEYIKIRFNASNDKKSRNVYENFKKKFGKDKTKEAALNYLEKYADKFWVDTDKIVKEMTEAFENQVTASASAEIKKYKADAGYSRKLSSEKKSQLVARFRKFVDSTTLTALNNVMKLLKEYNTDHLKEPVYILIDKIDEEWVEESVRYRLIRALIEAQRSFGKIDDLKIIVAVRADIFERVLQETLKPGTQREKFNDQLAVLQWSKARLKEAVDNRIRQLCKNRYIKKDVCFEDIFTHKIGTKLPFDYILERTHYRPRDIISFVNECLSLSEGNHEITKNVIIEAERKFSTGRVEALKNEWVSALPSIHLLLDLISARRYNFNVSELFDHADMEMFILKVSERMEDHLTDPIYSYIAENWKSLDEETYKLLAKLIISELYRIGAVSLKLYSGDRHYYSYKDAPTISANQIDDRTKIAIHPAFHIGLNVYKSNKHK